MACCACAGEVAVAPAISAITRTAAASRLMLSILPRQKAQKVPRETNSEDDRIQRFDDRRFFNHLEEALRDRKLLALEALYPKSLRRGGDAEQHAALHFVWVNADKPEAIR